ncbi:MAG: NAD(P)/FAD-dependent oxidoreductase [Solirubrobacterales bacterium]
MGNRQKIVIIGGGVAALETAIGLHECRYVDVDVAMIAPTAEFNYRPFTVLEPFGIRHVSEMPIRSLLDGCDVQLILDKVSRVDQTFKRVMTSKGTLIDFDALVVTTGAEPIEGLPGALTIGDKASLIKMQHMLGEIDAGLVRSVAFVATPGASWTLPIYECALLTAARARHQMQSAVRIHVITPEQRPLQIFGEAVGERVETLLRDAGIKLHTSTRAQSFDDRQVKTITGAAVSATRAVALPHLVGRRIPGLPHDANGFLPVDRLGHVGDTDSIYAAGDITDFSVKQGSIAAQQADAVVSELAVRFGRAQEARPFHPQLHAVLLSEGSSTFIRASGENDPHRGADVSDEPLWENAEKIFSRHLSQRMQRLRAAGTKLAAR